MTSIPQRFVNNIQLHLIRNLWNMTSNSTSLIMGIIGPPGEGKSYQCRKVLDGLGYKYVEMSTSDFGSALEADAAKRLSAKYVEASVKSQMEKRPYAIICDDIDAAVGQWSDLTQYTVNLQYIIGNLMHLCDSPSRVMVDRRMLPEKILYFLKAPDSREFEAPTIRIPIFFTGNDLTKLYPPLIRAGRMTVFKWLPTENEKLNIIAEILQPNLDMSETRQLIKECTRMSLEHNIDNLPISFYSSLKSKALDCSILETIKEDGWNISYTNFAQNRIHIMKHNLTHQNYFDVAAECIDSLVNLSYL